MTLALSLSKPATIVSRVRMSEKMFFLQKNERNLGYVEEKLWVTYKIWWPFSVARHTLGLISCTTIGETKRVWGGRREEGENWRN